MVNEKVQTAFNNISEYISDLEKKLAEKEKELSDKKEAASNLAAQKESAIEQLKQMEKDMSELSSVYEELKGKRDYQVNIQEVMKLYVVLTEQILDGSAHIKILTLLHGAKEYMTKNELSKASGIQPASTLRSIYDLRNNGLVEYNDQTEEVKLLRRLFD